MIGIDRLGLEAMLIHQAYRRLVWATVNGTRREREEAKNYLCLCRLAHKRARAERGAGR